MRQQDKGERLVAPTKVAAVELVRSGQVLEKFEG